MRYRKAKFFWKKNHSSKVISCIEYDDETEYYTFIKKCHSQKYRQIIITSELMIDIIKYFAIEKQWLVFEIDLAEDDHELKQDLEVLINNTNQDRIYFHQLIDELCFLSEQSSIDIKRVYIKGRDVEGVAINFFIQSNGIIGINTESFDNISNDIKKIIEEYLL